jgi:regulator of sirC expression with transglutaminase-like and TPR domain
VEQVTGEPFQVTRTALAGVSLAQLVQRMLSNLKAAYLRANDFGRAVRTIRRLRQLDPHDPFQERDLGASLLHAGQPGKAIDHLAGYLKSLPAAEDADAVHKLLRRARAELARWN